MSFIVCEKTDKGKYKPVSGEFSSPNFCFDYIDLAKRTGGGNNLKVMIKQGIKLTPYHKINEQINLLTG